MYGQTINSLNFDPSFVELASNKNRHKILVNLMSDWNCSQLAALEQLKIVLKMFVRMIETSDYIRLFLILQVTRTAIKSWMISNSGKIGQFTLELHVSALECRKSP